MLKPIRLELEKDPSLLNYKGVLMINFVIEVVNLEQLLDVEGDVAGLME